MSEIFFFRVEKMICFALQAFGFLNWFQSFAHQCGKVTLEPTCVSDVALCSVNTYEDVSRTTAYVGVLNDIGVVACSDRELFLTLDNDLILKAESVAELQQLMCR